MNVLRIHDEASQEAAREAEYYERKRHGLGCRFLDQLDATYDSILEYPLAAAVLEDTPFRKLRVRRFPNAVIYRVMDNEICVIAVANLYREPGYWKGRVFPDEAL